MEVPQRLVDNVRGVVDLGRVDDRAGLDGAGWSGLVPAEQLEPLEVGLDGVPVGVAACRQRLADTGWPLADADVAVAPDGVAELGEPPVLLGDDEVGVRNGDQSSR
jgi:hypothetical protein